MIKKVSFWRKSRSESVCDGFETRTSLPAWVIGFRREKTCFLIKGTFLYNNKKETSQIIYHWDPGDAADPNLSSKLTFEKVLNFQKFQNLNFLQEVQKIILTSNSDPPPRQNLNNIWFDQFLSCNCWKNRLFGIIGKNRLKSIFSTITRKKLVRSYIVEILARWRIRNWRQNNFSKFF